ncbi:MAG: hypothetical protein AB7E47_09960 [Desulfovibrionaceae bacterium]
MTCALALLLCAMTAASAHAATKLPLACEDIDKLTIFKCETSVFPPESPTGFYYNVNIRLTPEAATRLRAIYAVEQPAMIEFKGKTYPKVVFGILANGTVTYSDAPLSTVFYKNQIAFPLVRKEDAFRLARMICPAREPEYMSVHD